MGSITPSTPSKRVAIIGAGISGITTAKHLKEAGINAVVFERSARIGGNWLYDARRPLEPSYPSLKASVADSWAEKRENQGEEEWDSEDELRFAPPGPAYPGLTNNVTTKCQSLKDFPWPKETPDHVSVHVKQKYIQDYAEHFSIVPLIRFNTRVERLEKVGNVWVVRSITLVRDENGRRRREVMVEEFDIVVVASGHYHASKVPDIPGLREWKEVWPGRVEHSKRYRGPEEYRDQTILLIGGGVSSADIGRECSGIAKKIYQSSRGGIFDLPEVFISPEIERVTGISSFTSPSAKDKRAPGTVALTDGTVLTDIDRVIVCTGYLFSLPFLPKLHNDDLPAIEADENVLVTDGLQMHNLHRDIFYIPDPTLSFIGVPAYTATFSFFEYQSIAVSAVISGNAFLPSTSDMRAEYIEKVKEKGYGRSFHSLIRGQDEPYVEKLTQWLNRDAERTEGRKVEPYSEEWKMEKSKFFERYTSSLAMGKAEKPTGFWAESKVEKAFRGAKIEVGSLEGRV